MKIHVDSTAEQMGNRAAQETARRIRAAVQANGVCRILLSTGASQFEMLDALTKMEDIPWNQVVMFHLDEYVGMPMTHPASFRKYLKERFIDKVHPGAYFFVNGEGDIQKNISAIYNAAVHLDPETRSFVLQIIRQLAGFALHNIPHPNVPESLNILPGNKTQN